MAYISNRNHTLSRRESRKDVNPLAGHKSHWIITREDLRCLTDIGIQEHRRFFNRNQHLAALFEDGLLLVCLRQSAARHYCDPGFNTGFGDFDLWLFYEAKKGIRFPYRARLRKHRPVYRGKDVDVLRRAVTVEVDVLCTDDAVRAITQYVERRRRTVPKRDRKPDALVGLYPDEVFGETLWVSAE